MSRAVRANRAASSAGAEAGAGSAESTAVSCEIVRVGVFFDGTSNSRRHVGRANISWHTNVDILERLYENTLSKTKRNIGGVERFINSGSIYLRGIGVNEDGSDDLNGAGRGMGPEGVRQRVEQTVNQLRSEVRRMAQGMEVCDLWFDVFGFSRGAAAARHFSNLAKNGAIGLQKAKPRVKFLGLYDTVVMIGTGVATRGGDDNVNVRTSNVADKIVHFTAADEIRANFPLTHASTQTHYSIVGVHSDIGGGYGRGVESGSFEFEHEDYPGLPGYLSRAWGARDGVAPGDRGSADTLTTEIQSRWQIHDSGEPISTFRWRATHGLQFVPLKLMYDEAVAAGVPFDPWSDTIEGINVALSAPLSDYYDALKANRNAVPESMKKSIRLRYAHVSFNANRAYGFQANLPRTTGIRQFDRC
ncbi:MAG: phospholipase effector Tle1 domain-containing protein [Paracoccaceae bacterium]